MARVDITMSIKDVEGGDELRDSVVSKSGLVGMRGMNSVLPIVDVELERASSAWVLIDHIFMKVLSMLFTTFLLAGKLMKQLNLENSERAEGCHLMMKRYPHSKDGHCNHGF